MTEKRNPKFEEAMADPRGAFGSPYEVVGHTEYSLDEKNKILESWRTDEEELISAADEGMEGGEKNMLPDVLDAMRLLVEKTQGLDT